jgi:hypothetical protein
VSDRRGFETNLVLRLVVRRRRIGRINRRHRLLRWR